ncbi:hypothetical protein VSH64_24825 [Amycolatopsis rhabdoformis]|uniref:Uncharacterized protein n=1 Tax=Amycolatopsis rhabdoformis TaxID=1448059 RepID=A0ABZ1HX25_9PSEU|nr:hypothetical protein [Amycolatopsis rhabdoformis]WSE26102.1 hypothetical protein VSH64_24825 [Amycolatopsis rhabdoformis]
MPFAQPKVQYAVWDGQNLSEINQFLGSAYVGTGGGLYSPAFGGSLITDVVGTYVVAATTGFWETYPDEASFLARYIPLAVE